jgi:DNA polymerase-3 subunit delta'
MARVKVEGIPLVVGHEWAVELLTRGLATDRLSQAYLFAGPPRVGKTTLALYLARALNCLGPDDAPCGTCSACRRIEQNLHPDVRVIDDTGNRIKIDQIRELQREMALSPFEGRWRVYLLCDFQLATLEAANCLLKTLEEPPARVILILTATQPEMLLPTIVSRCQVLSLRHLPIEQVQQALRTHWGLAPDQAQLLARLSGGRMGWAIAASADDALLRNREKHFVALEQTLREGRRQRMALAQQLCQSPEALPDVFESWQSWWRDLLLARSGNTSALINVDRKQALQNEAQHRTVKEMLCCMRAIDRCAQHVEHNVNPCLALEVLLLGLPGQTNHGTWPRPDERLDIGLGPSS